MQQVTTPLKTALITGVSGQDGALMLHHCQQ